MLTIIHGDDITASRNFFTSERNKYSEKIILDGTNLTITDISQALSGNGLFGDQQTIFIDELISKRKPSKELDEIIAMLTKEQTASIFIWESKDLTAKQLAPFKNITIKQFKIPTIVFAFLDNISPNNKKLLTLFHQLLATEDANFALFMLQRQVRLLLSLHPDVTTSESKQSISEIKRLQPWQKTKLQKQAKLFSLDKLLELHNQLYQIELNQKTGKLSVSLEQQLDFLLTGI